MNALMAQRVEALEAAFRDIAATRMAGVPILHARLRVEAIGFAAEPGGTWAQGVLVTPWFMNLLRWPLTGDEVPLAMGVSGMRDCSERAMSFIGAEAPGFGSFEACSLFSPMHQFNDHRAAVATAQEVLAQLRAPAQPPPSPARRGFLLGRSQPFGLRSDHPEVSKEGPRTQPSLRYLRAVGTSGRTDAEPEGAR